MKPYVVRMTRSIPGAAPGADRIVSALDFQVQARNKKEARKEAEETLPPCWHFLSVTPAVVQAQE